MSGQMQTSQLHRRTSRGSTNQPACRSARVEKPKSHHNSPKAMMERRKTTTEPKLYATLDDHYRMMFGMAAEEVEERPQPSRPVSWHPSCSQYQASQPTNYCQSQQQWSQEWSPSSRDSYHGSDFYSLSTRNSMLEPMTAAPAYSNESEYPWQSVSQNTPTYMHSSMNTPTTEPLPWYLQQWAQKNQAQTSNDFLPIQHPSQQDQDMEEDDGEKLVALGLYDAPEPASSWGMSEGTGKGLKLEETWQPPEEENDEEDEEDDDDASSEASVDEPSPPLPPVHEQPHMAVHVQSQTPGSMEGQSFFFDEDETASKEWWFQQVKQPSMPVRDAGLGYGWI
ncbi:cell morphogenesis Las1 [Pyrenophora seminiperda CCB06]|uniref:Cell morphogenesis Las1 n=1 Tax=Pyrenophora seminiperda CCB06 TaxID=1302712 RepID=A0A3M7MA06_9PLEO|nr:cell morphogenesis Las1 [Pyrenophora seminiperda CCB06]